MCDFFLILNNYQCKCLCDIIASNYYKNITFYQKNLYYKVSCNIIKKAKNN